MPQIIASYEAFLASRTQEKERNSDSERYYKKKDFSGSTLTKHLLTAIFKCPTYCDLYLLVT
jgi:hypothetical protein